MSIRRHHFTNDEEVKAVVWTNFEDNLKEYLITVLNCCSNDIISVLMSKKTMLKNKIELQVSDVSVLVWEFLALSSYYSSVSLFLALLTITHFVTFNSLHSTLFVAYDSVTLALFYSRNTASLIRFRSFTDHSNDIDLLHFSQQHVIWLQLRDQYRSLYSLSLAHFHYAHNCFNPNYSLTLHSQQFALRYSPS